MNHASIREEYGAVFASDLPDGRTVPWSPLNIGDYIYYDRMLKSGQYPVAYIENEIFKKCVSSDWFCEHIDELKAGTVSNIVTAIMSYSGPHTVEELTYMLNLKRHEASEIIHDIVGTICQAFPSYTPEDIYEMNYDKLMFRLAQSEFKLLRTGMLQEPITFETQEETQKEIQNPKEVKVKAKTDDLLERFYAQEGIIDPQTNQRVKKKSKPKKTASKSKQTIISTDDIKEHQMQYSGHEMEDRFLLEHDMVNDTAMFYKEYLDQLQKDGRITMKTDEERKAAALKRAKKHESIINQVNASKSKKDKDLQDLIIKHRNSKKKKGKSIKRK